MVGKEAVYDVVALAVQEWPAEKFSQCQDGDEAERGLLQGLEQDVRRHMDLVYGDRKCGSVWIIALQFILPIIIRLVYEWWKKRKENKDRMAKWQSELVGDTNPPTPPVDNG